MSLDYWHGDYLRLLTGQAKISNNAPPPASYGDHSGAGLYGSLASMTANKPKFPAQSHTRSDSHALRICYHDILALGTTLAFGIFILHTFLVFLVRIRDVLDSP